MIQLVDAYQDRNAEEFLYLLLGQRKRRESISHKSMPTAEEHAQFFASRPYIAWYVIEMRDNGNELPQSVGSCYLSKRNEIGIAVALAHRHRGHATAAIKLMMQMHHNSRPFLANVAPHNYASAKLFHKLGFGILQHVLSTDAPRTHQHAAHSDHSR